MATARRAPGAVGQQAPRGRWINATDALACYLPQCTRATAAYFQARDGSCDNRVPRACERRREVARAPGVEEGCMTSRIARRGLGRWPLGSSGGC